MLTEIFTLTLFLLLWKIKSIISNFSLLFLTLPNTPPLEDGLANLFLDIWCQGKLKLLCVSKALNKPKAIWGKDGWRERDWENIGSGFGEFLWDIGDVFFKWREWLLYLLGKFWGAVGESSLWLWIAANVISVTCLEIQWRTRRQQ